MLNRWARGCNAGVRVVLFSVLREEGAPAGSGTRRGERAPRPVIPDPRSSYSLFGRTDGSAGDFEEGILNAEIALVGTS
jgi:hypothetical protein